jgi:predicted nucleic acid-binding protein
MCISAKGAARELIRLAIRQQVKIVTSAYVFDETEINLTEKSPRSLPTYRYIRSRAFWTLVEATRKEAAAAEGATPDVFDTPIVAAAKKAKVDALVTFDRKHLIRPSVADYIGAAVATPDQVLKRVRAEGH